MRQDNGSPGAGYVARLGGVVDRHRADHAVRTALDRAESAAQEAQSALADAHKANAAKTQFLANISHELRTPMNAIIGFAEILGRRNESARTIDLAPERVGEYAGYILQAGSHLLVIIDDLLDTAKIESGAFTLTECDVNLVELAQTCEQVVAQLAADKGIDLTFALEEELPFVWADPQRLEQILINLLSNAVKFTPDGGRVALKMGPVRRAGIEMSVSDSGIGIDPGDIEKALTAFQQIEHHLTRNYGGTGLGLPLAKYLTELHGGILEIDSAVDAGTVVTVTLPASRIRTMAAGQAALACAV
ncbi:MAG: HAMP domain-containing sensor histidine kinase [Alphaproteobacteria bacterium]|nr:HAMP domain-containing sensor histidine kinase [Alphaproteobacteria bacterium]